ncbi:hypothetical protein MML63_09290 [Kosakonia sacchari]|uniref:hypothetical protein n=1 Tax=Kosakonia sacchari TaxID=1158459 RepID=UPI0025B01A1B|nr:hypothetical protein [Kosakonia sacchari]MDN2485822.1 hypothetical protein [Kosakonia sacchari]
MRPGAARHGFSVFPVSLHAHCYCGEDPVVPTNTKENENYTHSLLSSKNYRFTSLLWKSGVLKVKSGGYAYDVKTGNDRQGWNCGIIILPASSVYAGVRQKKKG